MHIPVLQKEIISFLNPRPNKNFIDATFGGGGHSKIILEKNKPYGKVLAIEIDPDLFQKNNIQNERLILVNDSYANIEDILRENSFGPVDGILFDLGMSSWHIKESKRGFSFKRDEALDMRFNPLKNILTAFEIVNYWPEEKIANVLSDFGQERFFRAIAKKIVQKRKIKPIRTTFDLVEIIKEAVGRQYQRQKIHCATRTFQALRIAVNDELNNLKRGLDSAKKALEKEGKIVVISFHSLEDRIVKNFFRNNQQSNNLKVVTKKPISPFIEEVKENPSARSAKLRVAQKI